MPSPIAISTPSSETGLLRADGSSCHAAALDPQTRAVTGLFSLQGWTDSSIWARGQAWAMLGFAHGYEVSATRTISTPPPRRDWYVEHVPPGWVPRYDYDDPDRETLPYDSCAACIATAVLLRLAPLAARPRPLLPSCRPRNPEDPDCQLSQPRRRRAARKLGPHAAP